MRLFCNLYDHPEPRRRISLPTKTSFVILRYEVPKNLVAERSEGSSPYYLFCIWNFGKQSLDKIETSLNSLYNNLLSPAIMLTVPALPIRRGDRVVEGNGLENRRCASNRRFESCPLRQLSHFHREESFSVSFLAPWGRGLRWGHIVHFT